MFNLLKASLKVVDALLLDEDKEQQEKSEIITIKHDNSGKPHVEGVDYTDSTYY